MSATQHPPFVLYRRLSYCYLSLIFNIISLYAKIYNLTLYKQYLKTLFDIILIRIFLNTINILLYDMPRTICAKRFSVLSQTIFQPAEIDFRMYWFRLTHSFILIPPLYLPQTVFRPKRFASFRPPLYQRFKVNFLPYNPSPGFHRKTGCPHETVFNKFAVTLVFNRLRWRAWQRLFHVVYLQTRKHRKHKA